MLLRRHHPRLDETRPEPAGGFEHLDDSAASTLAWLAGVGVEFVLVGPLAASIRGATGPRGPVSIVPAPYRRNFARLAGALAGERVFARIDGGGEGGSVKLTATRLGADMLARGQLRTLRIGARDLDIEGIAAGLPSYQELLYDANRFEIAKDVFIEVASPEDIERYDHLRRTGIAPEITVRRLRGNGPGALEAGGAGEGDTGAPAPNGSGPAPTEAHRPG